MSDVVTLASDLIRCPSVTPTTAGVFDVIEAYLKPLGFTAHRVTFAEEGHDTVENLYLRYGTQAPNFCFAGHTDVVPPGNLSHWTVPPFSPHVIGGELYGRGAEDMKGAIAAFMIAAKNFIQDLDPAVRSAVAARAAKRRGSGEAEGGEGPPSLFCKQLREFALLTVLPVATVIRIAHEQRQHAASFSKHHLLQRGIDLPPAARFF